MISKIICDTCQKILREGDIGAPTETKTCINCVTSLAPMADPKKIKRPPSMADTAEFLANKAKNEKILEKAREKNLEIEMDSSIIIQGEQVLFVLNFTIEKIKNFDIGFTREQLLAFIEDIERVEAEEHK